MGINTYITSDPFACTICRCKHLFTYLLYACCFYVMAAYLFCGTVHAQLPTCGGPAGNMIYYINGGVIYNLNPTQPLSATNPSVNTITAPGGSGALAVSNNLNGAGPSPTFYVIANGVYYYHDGNQWINTGHGAGAVNPGAAGNYIFSLNGSNGDIYKYDGTGHATLLTGIADFNGGGPFDLAGDCHGNFYILRTANPQYLRKYSPSGVLLQSWTVTGAAAMASGGGMAIIGNAVYYYNQSGYWLGAISGSSVSFTLVSTQWNVPPGDFGSCPVGTPAMTIRASIDTFYYCKGSPPVPVTFTGAYTTANAKWTLISGQAAITGTGDTITVAPQSTCAIVLQVTDTTLCEPVGVDTVHIIVPDITLDAGNDVHLTGCGSFTDTVNLYVSNLTPHVPYTLSWQPPAAAAIAPFDPHTMIINPADTTKYIIRVATDTNRGGCIFTDTFTAYVEDRQEDNADFDYTIDLDCNADKVSFLNKTQTKFGPLTYRWDFGDKTPVLTVKNPLHVYEKQGVYDVTLYAHNGLCTDSITRRVSTLHPLKAAFSILDTPVCILDTVDFDASPSVTPASPGPYQYEWLLSDGRYATGITASFVFDAVQDVTMTLVVTDTLGCRDTTIKTITGMQQAPYVDIGPADTSICNDEALTLPLGISVRGTGYRWQDGSTSPVYNVKHTGTYTVTISNDCGTMTNSIDVIVKDCTLWFPTAFSPDGNGLNDKARVQSTHLQDVSNFELGIYNRYGQKVYYTRNIAEGWDGNYNGMNQPTGTYYYMIRYTVGGEQQLQKGDIILLR